MARLFGAVLLVAVMAVSVSCSSGTERVSQRAGKGASQETAAVSGGPRESTAPGGAHAASPWDYVALGDSLAAGVGARRGYVARYAAHVRSDTGARVEVLNLGRSGQTSSELLHALRTNGSVRGAISAAEVITFNIGINDLGHAGLEYENGTCGGEDNRRCLRRAVEVVKRNWDAIIAELLGLHSTSDAIIRTAGLGYTPRVGEDFRPYVVEVNRHIAAAAASNDIPHAQPHLEGRHMSPDGVHPNDDGYEVMADRLRELGYSPLKPAHQPS